MAVDVLDLLLTARYVGAPAFRALAADMEGLTAAGNGWTRVGAAFQAVGDMMVAAGVAAAAGLGEAVKAAADYDSAMQRIVSVTPYLQEHTNALAQLNKEISNAATAWGINPTDIASGTYMLMSSAGVLGQNGVQNLLSANIVNQLAMFSRASGFPQAGGVSYADAASQLPRIFAAANLPVDQWGNAMGIMTFLENQAHMNQSQMTNAMGAYLPIMTSLNMPFNDAATLMAAIASSGRVGAPAGREAMSALTLMFGGATQQAALQSIGLSTGSFFDKSGNFVGLDQMLTQLQQAINKKAGNNPAETLSLEHALFGQVGLRAFGPLLSAGGMAKYQSLLAGEQAAGINTPGGALAYMQAVANRQMQAPGAQFDQLKASLQLLAITIGNDVLPVVMSFVHWLTNLAGTLTQLATAHPELTKALAVSVVPALLGGGFGMKGVGSLLQWLGTNQAAVDARNLRGSSAAEDAMSQWLGTTGNRNFQFSEAEAALNARNAERLTSWEAATSSANSRFADVLAQDAEKKRQLYDTALGTWLSKRQAVEQKAAGDLAKLTGAYEQTRAGIPLGKGAGTVLEVDKQYAQDRAALEQQLKRDLGALKPPSRADYFTPYGGTYPAMPLRPEEEALRFGTMPVRPPAFQSETSLLGRIGAPFQTLFNFGRNPIPALTTAFENFGTVLGRVGNVIMNPIESLGRLLGVMRNFGGALLDVARATPAFLGGLTAVGLPILLLVGAVTTIVLLFTAFHKQGEELASFFGGMLSDAFHVFLAIVQSVLTTIKSKWDEVFPKLEPAINTLVAAIKRAQPVFTLLGGVVLAALSVVGAAIAGVANAFLGVLPTIIDILSRIVSIITDVVMFVVDLITFQWGQIPGIVGDLFGSIFAIVGDTFGTILGFVGGFVQGVVNFFQWLFDILVGHSIIPDLVNAIIQLFEQLLTLPAQWGADLINLFVGGITGALGGLWDAITNMASGIVSFLGFSVPTRGPLSTADKWMPDMMTMMGDGITANQNKVLVPIQNVAQSMAQAMQNGINDANNAVQQGLSDMQLAQARAAKMYQPGSYNVNPNEFLPQQILADQYTKYFDQQIRAAIAQVKQDNAGLTIYDFLPKGFLNTNFNNVEYQNAYTQAYNGYTQYTQAMQLQQAYFNAGFTQANAGTINKFLQLWQSGDQNAFRDYQTFLNDKIQQQGIADHKADDLQRLHNSQQQQAIKANTSIVTSLMTQGGNQQVSGYQATLNKLQGVTNTSMSDIQSIMRDKFAVIASIPASMRAQFYNSALQAMQGFIDGVNSKAAAVGAAVEGVMSRAIAHANNRLQIASPSRVFHEMGAMTMRGYQQGVSSHTMDWGNLVPRNIGSLNVGSIRMGSDNNSAYRFARGIQAEREGVFNRYNMDRDGLSYVYRLGYEYTG